MLARMDSMTHRVSKAVFTSGVAVAMLLLSGGCFQYKGALGADGDGDSRSVMEQSKVHQRVSKPVNFGAPNQSGGVPMSGHGIRLVDGQAILSPAAHWPLGPLSLYSHLGQQRQISRPLGRPGNIAQITFASDGADFDPSVDSTGTFLAFATTQHRPTADIYIKQIGGTAITQLTDDPANDVMPDFSPDGKRIAFASDRSGNWDIYIMAVNGGPPIQMTSGNTQDIHPSFSPDGRQLVFCSYAAQSG